jgi:xanthine dehydrogenase YagR molybdenum-binding subunit
MADDLKPSLNPIEENRQGLIGADIDRIDGPLKASGRAPYAYEVREVDNVAYGVVIGAGIAKGRVSKVDTKAAEASPGVLLVWTHKTVPAQPRRGERAARDSQAGAEPAFPTDRIRYFGEPVAFVCADTLENARAAALLVKLDYKADRIDVELTADKGEKPEGEDDVRKGDFEKAFAGAPLKIDETWTTPVQNHAQMEPCASLCWWEGDHLIAHTSNQLLKRPQHGLAETLRIPRQNVRLISRFIGGGFGGKLTTYEDLTLAALASRALKRPVKVAYTRQQMFHATTHRSGSIQRVRLGAEKDGTLQAIAIDAHVHCARDDPFTEHAASFARGLYAAPHRLMRHRLVKLDLPVAGAMRAPGEAIGMLSLECAIDELAEKLGMDPIALRLKNEPQADPETGASFSSRHLAECYEEGARRFGWRNRNPKPGQVRDGRWLVGVGMAASIRSNFLLPAKAKLAVDRAGTITLRQAMTDIGTGAYTILAQIVAETMGVALSAVRIELGDSGFAPTPGSGGSFGAASAGSAALDAGMNLRAKLAALATGDSRSPLHGGDPKAALFTDGAIVIENRTESLAALVARAAPEGVEADGQITPGAEGRRYSQHAHGAHFAEVGVDADTGEVRLRRMLGVFAAGRILNAKTAKSQMTGGMIWGVGGALTEQNPVDPRYGSFVNQDLANYYIPAHADVPNIDAIFLPERDDIANPMGIKGVGELGICGAGAAVANAVYNACGVRVRDYPITLDKILAHLPA